VDQQDMTAPCAVARLEGVAVVTPEKTRILDGIDWLVASGEQWVVLGPNGAGKSTLLSILSAQRHPSEGRTIILGEVFGRTDMRALRSRIGLVDPSMRILDWLNAEEVVLTGLKNTIWPRYEDWSEADYARARELLYLVGCGDFAERELKTLSHGERQRIRIARALIAAPELLLLDEPATGLDFPAREALLLAMDSLRQSHPALPIVMVSHHLEELPTTISHVLLLRGGRILAQGPAREMLTSELISACFGFDIEVYELGGRWAARAAAGWGEQSAADHHPAGVAHAARD
jgi:iron complex transport system ATP-binding protein